MMLFGIVLAVLAVVLAFSSVITVPQGYAYTLEYFGRYTKTLKPGLSIIVPFVERIGARINVMESVLDIKPQDAITRDNASVHVDGVLYYQVLRPERAAYEVNNLTHALINLAMTNIRTVIGSMDLDDLLSHREVINAKLLEVMDVATDPWGVKITRVEIKDIRPPQDLVDAMARQMKAEREKRARILDAEGIRQSEILQAEGEKQSKILEAEGLREAAYREAEGRERLAQAEAKSTQMVSEAIDKGNVQAVNYFVAQEYVKALGQIADSHNSKIIMMPLEASNVIGTIGGVAELVKDAFGGDKQAVTKRKSV